MNAPAQRGRRVRMKAFPFRPPVRRMGLVAGVIACLAVAYAAAYLGARSSHLLVRTCAEADWTGRPSRWSNRIIPGRGTLAFGLAGALCWRVFRPAHTLETWYRNRPSYFFREAIRREKRSSPITREAPDRAPAASFARSTTEFVPNPRSIPCPRT